MNCSISIIIPVYNVEKYIVKCLQSVASQTLTKGIECIIVDDLGSDNSIQLALDFINNYEGDISFSIIHRKQNGGLSAARNTGIEAATKKYLYFLDSDDEITPDCTELMWGLIDKHGEVDLVQGSFYETEKEKSSESTFCFPEYTINQKQIKTFLLTYAGDIVGAQSRLIRKDFLLIHNLFFKEGIIHEDNYWTFFLAKYVKSMAFCPVRTYYHRYNPNSITGNVNVAKETLSYRTIINDCSTNIDFFLPGRQKELILNTLITVLQSRYYGSQKEKEAIINVFANQNSLLERCILKLFLNIKNKYMRSKVLHLLIRIYKIED